MVRTMTKRNAVASKSAGACTGRTECRNINGERRTIPQLVSTLSRQNQCDLNLLHPLQHPLDRSTSPRACVPACLPACLPCVPLSFELPLHVQFHYRKQSAAAPLYGVCTTFTDYGYKLLLLPFFSSSSTFAISFSLPCLSLLFFPWSYLFSIFVGNMLFHSTGTMVLVTRSDVDFCECYTCTKRQERTDRGKMERGNAI